MFVSARGDNVRIVEKINKNYEMSVNLKIFNREKVIKIKLKKLRVGTTE